MPELAVTARQREAGIWSVRLSIARTTHACLECKRPIFPGVRYYRHYGRMADACQAWTACLCESCVAEQRLRYGT